jgi:hypothetical protein
VKKEKKMKQLMAAVGLLSAALVLTPGFPAYPDCAPLPVITRVLPRLDAGWSGAVAWYNGKIYEVTGAYNHAVIRNPITGVEEGQIQFGSWAAHDINGFTYDPFRGTFWVKVHEWAYEVAVTGGDWISRFDVNNGGRGMAFGIWKDPDEEHVMWVADPVQPEVRKVDMRNGSVLQYVFTAFPVRGVARSGAALWCTRAGESGQAGVLSQFDMRGNELCGVYLPWGLYDHDAGGCEVDPEGYLWVHGGKGTAIYRIDIGYRPGGGDPPVIDSGDYSGDGTSDIAVFRPASGLWAIKGLTRAYFGRDGDIPAPGDFDGDGSTDIAIFRTASGLWAVTNLTRAYFGADGDIPVPGDYTGDGTVTPAVFRPAAGLWAVKGVTRTYFGRQDDIPVPFYPDGPAAPKKIAVFRPASGLWAAPGQTRVYFGAEGDQPVRGSYGAGTYNPAPAVFRPAAGLWAIRQITRAYFGRDGDIPVPGNYSGFLPDEIGIFRPSTGLWAVRYGLRTYFGQEGDIPVSGLAVNPSSAGAL